MASAGHGVMTDRYLGILSVLDDDPAPQVSISTTQKTVKEGSDAVWQISLSKAVDYDFGVSAKVVHGSVSVPRLTKSDVAAGWIRTHASETGTPTTPLEKMGIFEFASVRPGRRTAEIRIPIVKDGDREGVEAITLRFNVDGHSVARTVFIAASS